MGSVAATVPGRQRSPRGAGADCRTRSLSVTDFYGIQAGTIPGFAEASGGDIHQRDGPAGPHGAEYGHVHGQAARDARARPAGVRCVRTARRFRHRGPSAARRVILAGATTPPVDTRAPLAHSASSVSAQRVSVTAAKKRSSARPTPALLGRHGAAQRLAGCRRHQSLASFAHGSVIRIRRAPKSMTKVASSWILMTRPRPYLSCVTWSCSANCSAGGAGGAGPKGLVGRRRRVAARAGSITTSMRPRHWP
jgi:hypothetical protein